MVVTFVNTGTTDLHGITPWNYQMVANETLTTDSFFTIEYFGAYQGISATPTGWSSSATSTIGTSNVTFTYNGTAVNGGLTQGGFGIFTGASMGWESVYVYSVFPTGNGGGSEGTSDGSAASPSQSRAV